MKTPLNKTHEGCEVLWVALPLWPASGDPGGDDQRDAGQEEGRNLHVSSACAGGLFVGSGQSIYHCG